MEWRLIHTTHYQFPCEVNLGPHQIRLKPSGLTSGQMLRHRLQIWPQPSLGHWRQDLWNNQVYQAWFSEKARSLRVVNRLLYRPQSGNPFAFAVEGQALHQAPSWDRPWQASLGPYLESPACETERNALAAWTQPCAESAGDSISLGVQLNQRVHQSIRYRPRHEPGTQSGAETLRLGSGSCRDLAWLLVLCLRSLNYPARFVSGYWFQVESEQAELHAWCEYYLPGAGWIGLDPTAGLVVHHQHLALARCPFPEAAAPVLGSHSGEQSDCQFKVRVVRQR